MLAAVTISAVAQILFKLGLNSLAGSHQGAWSFNYLFSGWIIGGLILYGVGTLLWLGALSKIDLSQAYPFVSVGFALTAIAGWTLFGEAMTALRVGGVLTIALGVCLLAAG
jgi:multidrug transporter EmrE-like cation transporter